MINLLNNPNPFKLAVFAANVFGGISVSTYPKKIQVTWEESLRLAQTADRLGLDAMIPIARWKTFGGPSDHNGRAFDTNTWAAALAAITKNISIFSTVHVATINPVLMAKQGATIDHVSGGRFGLNVVSGYVPAETDLFGADFLEHDERYAYADEWMQLVKRLWAEDDFDFRGKYFTSIGASSDPKPIQRPRPMIMNAGNSAAGSAFAATHADVQYINIIKLETAADQVAAVRKMSREMTGRDKIVMASTQIFCRDTEAEAKEYRDFLLHEMGDVVGAKSVAKALLGNAQSLVEDEGVIQRIMLTMGGWPIIGTPDQVVEQFKALRGIGLDGVALSWPDFDDGLARYERDLLPRLQAAGMRI